MRPLASHSYLMEAAALPTAVPLVPLLASAQFCMEVLLAGAVLDVGSVLEIVHVDPCAVLRLYEALSDEVPSPLERPERLGEVIALLGVAGLQRALVYAPSTWAQQAALSRFAAHAVARGRAAETLASEHGRCPQAAYLRGLLENLHELPTLLDWSPLPAAAPHRSWLTTWIASYRLPSNLAADLIASKPVDRANPIDRGSTWLTNVAFHENGLPLAEDPASPSGLIVSS